MPKHHAHVFQTFEQYLAYCLGSDNDKLSDEQKAMLERQATVRWKKHIEKHGNVPLILQCGICSGHELKTEIKHGRYKPARKTKAERDEDKGKDE